MASILATSCRKLRLKQQLQGLIKQSLSYVPSGATPAKRCELEDAAWRVTWSQQRYEKPSAEENANTKPRAHWGSVKAQEEHRQELRKHTIGNSPSNANRKTNSGA